MPPAWQALGSSNPFTIFGSHQCLDCLRRFLKTISPRYILAKKKKKTEVRLNAYPDTPITGTIANIGASLDPGMRSAKVRIEIHNPGNLRPGMFATAIFSRREAGKPARPCRRPRSSICMTAIGCTCL